MNGPLPSKRIDLNDADGVVVAEYKLSLSSFALQVQSVDERTIPRGIFFRPINVTADPVDGQSTSGTVQLADFYRRQLIAVQFVRINVLVVDPKHLLFTTDERNSQRR